MFSFFRRLGLIYAAFIHRQRLPIIFSLFFVYKIKSEKAMPFALTICPTLPSKADGLSNRENPESFSRLSGPPETADAGAQAVLAKVFSDELLCEKMAK